MYIHIYSYTSNIYAYIYTYIHIYNIHIYIHMYICTYLFADILGLTSVFVATDNPEALLLLRQLLPNMRLFENPNVDRHFMSHGVQVLMYVRVCVRVCVCVCVRVCFCVWV